MKMGGCWVQGMYLPNNPNSVLQTSLQHFHHWPDYHPGWCHKAVSDGTSWNKWRDINRSGCSVAPYVHFPCLNNIILQRTSRVAVCICNCTEVTVYIGLIWGFSQTLCSKTEKLGLLRNWKGKPRIPEVKTGQFCTLLINWGSARILDIHLSISTIWCPWEKLEGPCSCPGAVQCRLCLVNFSIFWMASAISSRRWHFAFYLWSSWQKNIFLHYSVWKAIINSICLFAVIAGSSLGQALFLDNRWRIVGAEKQKPLDKRVPCGLIITEVLAQRFQAKTAM